MKPYIISPTLSPPASLTGASGSPGSQADCNITGYPPDDGGKGDPSFYGYIPGTTTTANSLNGSSFVGITSTAGSYGSTTEPGNSGFYISATGGNGGTGGYGKDCYSGYGGGKGGYGAGNKSASDGTIVPLGVINTTAMITKGVGITIMSKGGQGGNGGNTASTLDAGDGGIGGDGGAINIVNNQTITTIGIAPITPAPTSSQCSSANPPASCTTYNAIGIFAQSTGGGAGNGGTNNNSMAGSGGSAKAGGAGGDIYIHNTSTISTTYGYGILAISAGGFGGDGGSSAGFIAAPNGAAGFGGAGGNVTVLNDWSVNTNAIGQHAMIAISVGGGGGVAGHSSALLALGGSGGSGAAGGAINIQNGYQVATNGLQSAGLLGISVGGGGGIGGMASGAVIGGGGSGGGGGNGGNVLAVNYGSICTGGGCSAKAASSSGGSAPALAGISIGGGGGMGGFGSSVGIPASAAWGGSGGNGGDGGWVQLLNNGPNNALIQTTEASSPAILGVSIGGGGGTGGGAVAGSAAVVNPSTSITVGGSGGSGGAGGPVGINCGQTDSHSSSISSCTNAQAVVASNNKSLVNTFGDSSPAFMAASVGGGGGMGGFAVSLAASTTSSTSISVGGKGGSGGNGGNVYANTAGAQVTTYGAHSSGIEALSVGGGGGHGGITMYTPDYVPGGSAATASASVSVGGNGGGGGKGATIIAENLGGSITTYGERSSGIHASSIGGHGGHGGLAAGGAAGLALSVSSTVGGNGGSGNTGGNVSVYNNSSTSKISTYGVDSHAIEAASIGGGGGSGGWSAGAGVSLGLSTTLSVGGVGGSGGDGGTVSVTNYGILHTYGHNSTGILAHSIGGGGGNGGSTATGDVALIGDFSSTVGGVGGGGGKGGTVTVDNNNKIINGTLTAPALGSQGIVAMSIGGGGGRGGLAVGGSITGGGSLSDVVGGGTHGGGDGGTVKVTNSESVVTIGDLSNGILAMSVGGRGGLGGIAIGGAVSTGVPLNVTLGSQGGDGGDGGDVTVTNSSSLTTAGFRAIGVSAQSIGGHGGMGGISLGTTLSNPTVPSSTITLGGTGGKGGQGGTATVNTDTGSTTSTTGPFSPGLIAQSIGGDGGIGGIGAAVATSIISPSITLGGAGGKGGAGGMALMNSYGTVTTNGANSAGMLAQSIGGNGGLAGFIIAAGSADRVSQITTNLGSSGGSGADGGAVWINEFGQVATLGALSPGVVSESIGGGGGRTSIAINFDVINTSTEAAGVNLASGGTGGGGGNGWSAAVNQGGAITTSGAQSEAIYAGSIGGGGGSAGSSFVNLSSSSKTFSLAVGGNSGSGGKGQDVTVYSNYGNAPSAGTTVSTSGVFSDGIFAQTVGGGGGASSGYHSLTSAGGLLGTSMQLGSYGTGSGGDGGGVYFYTGGAINTSGVASNAIFGQSVGGGGGKTLVGISTPTPNLSIPYTNIQFSTGGSTSSSSTASAGTSTTGPGGLVTFPASLTVGAASSIQLGGYKADSGYGGSINVTSTSAISTIGNMSDGIKLESIGGGGGFSAMSDIRSGSPFAGAAAYLGGGGSGGGNGGAINLSQKYTIETQGALSSGIFTQSIGGGGGDSRLSSISSLGLTSGFASTLGTQDGGYGGIGLNISIQSNWLITTNGMGSDGVVGQAVGGGGGFSALYGNGDTPPSFASSIVGTSGQSWAGASTNNQVTSSSSQASTGVFSNGTRTGAATSTLMGTAMAAALGSSDGGNNSGKPVTITNDGWILTGNSSKVNGDGAFGMIAQSIGGGGGIARQHLNNFDQSQTSVSMMLGAISNTYGYGSDVTINNNIQSYDAGNYLQTTGRGSVGILAQSIGGGGGLGMLTERTSGTAGSANISLVLGGAGSSTGDSGSVYVNSGSTSQATPSYLITTGDQAEGIIAQSITNGGGVVKIDQYATSPGLFFNTTPTQSAYSSMASTSAQANNGLAFGITMGSTSTNGANSSSVTVNSSNVINTTGNRSTAIVAQSISGGGGVVDIVTNNLNSGNFTGSVNMGGKTPGQVGSVSVTSNLGILTGGSQGAGIFSDGVLAQSITYGGGSFGVVDKTTANAGNGLLAFTLGANNMGTSVNAQPVSVYVTDVMTYGFGASAITAQSIGGGGGLLAYYVPQGSISGAGTLGGYGNGHGSDGSSVTVTTSGYITTNGDMAPMIIAQSIGGGGGRVVGNASIYESVPGVKLGDLNANGESSPVTVTTWYPIASGGNNSPGIIAQSIGGGGGILNFPTSSWSNVQFGGDNSAGDSVTVNSNGSITTYGYGSFGILAQSIGGGGGFATMIGTPTFGSPTTSGGADAGTVTVTSKGAINTWGVASPGIIAVSIGGGGGVALMPQNSTVSYGLNKGSGNGGKIVVNVDAPITTRGAGSDGVVAVSIGGGGGLSFYSNGLIIEGGAGRGSAGTITINNQSTILTGGAYSTAIRVMQVNGRDDPVVNIAPGASAIGGPGGSGVSVGGDINNINNSGYISTLDGINGHAITSISGVTTVNNSGVTYGDIVMAGSGNVVNNLSGGSMYFINHPRLGADGVLNNSGYLQYNPSGLSSLGILNHSGTLNQLATGVLGIKFDHQNNLSDLISIGSDGHMNLAGRISPVLVNPGLIAPGSVQKDIFINSGGTLNADQLGVVNTAVMTYGLVKETNSIKLTSTANFAPEGLTSYSSQIGRAIGDYQSAGSNTFFRAATAQLVTIPTVGGLDQAYSNLAGTAIQAIPQANYQAVSRAVGTVSDRMNSWRVGNNFTTTSMNPGALTPSMVSMYQPMALNAPQIANGNLSVDGAQMPSLGNTANAKTWFTPFGGASNSNNLTDRIYGGSIGIDLQSDNRTYIGGAALTVSQSNFNFSSASTPTTPGSAANYGASFYFGARSESAYLTAIGYLGGSNGNFTRQLQTLSFNTSTGVSVNSNILGARLEAGYNLLPNSDGKQNLQITPFVAIAPTQIRQNGANENFADFGSGFHYGSNTNTAVPIYLGAEISADLELGEKEVLKPFMRVSWAHDLMNRMTTDATYSPTYGPTLYANGTPSMGNMVIVKAGAKYNWGTNVSAYATLDIEQSTSANSFRGIGGSIGVIYSW